MQKPFFLLPRSYMLKKKINAKGISKKAKMLSLQILKHLIKHLFDNGKK